MQIDRWVVRRTTRERHSGKAQQRSRPCLQNCTPGATLRDATQGTTNRASFHSFAVFLLFHGIKVFHIALVDGSPENDFRVHDHIDVHRSIPLRLVGGVLPRPESRDVALMDGAQTTDNNERTRRCCDEKMCAELLNTTLRCRIC